MNSVWFNGVFFEEDRAAISLRDAGLLHGAGVFTTMRAYGGKVFRLADHLRRIRASCEALFIPLLYKDEQITEAVGALLTRNRMGDARLRLTVTRGTAQQDPVHGLRLEPNTFLTAAEMQPYPAEFYEKGMTVTLLDEQKLNAFDIQAGHKTLDYFSRLGALRAANQRGAGESLWFDTDNRLQSGSISNIFLVKGDTLLTPPTTAEAGSRRPVLPGITRCVVMELAAAAGIPVQQVPIDVNPLLEADEVFLTNSIMQIMPVCRLERRAVGEDRPGKITMRLSAAYENLVGRP